MMKEYSCRRNLIMESDTIMGTGCMLYRQKTRPSDEKCGRMKDFLWKQKVKQNTFMALGGRDG